MSSQFPSPENYAKPDAVTGGCLCGAIRFRIDFPKDHDFLKMSESCQCTQCRRNTGSLIWHAHTIPTKSLTYTTSTSTLKNFSATEGVQRGFCAECGSFLYWKQVSSGKLDFSVGCIDPEYLLGDNDKHKGYGYALANCCGNNLFCQHEIKGVNDGWVGKDGKRWATTSDNGVPAE